MSSLEEIRDLIKSCMLPELKQDLDSIPIEREHFETYDKCLQLQLPILYDWIQQRQTSCPDTGDETEETKREIESFLIILLCEVSCSNSIYKLSSTELIRNAERILLNYRNISKEIEELLLKYYEDKLHKDKWKRQLGAVHGFVKYLEFRSSNTWNYEHFMSNKLLMFCLSVSLNIRSCYETHYKDLSNSIFLIMLQQGVQDDIISTNVHSVIYDAVFKDAHIMDSVTFIERQWSCLLKCMDFYKNFDSFSWGYLDDIMEVLLRNISLAPDSAASLCLMKFVGSFIVYYTINRNEYEQIFSKKFTQLDNVKQYRLLGTSNTSYTNYRWAKTILQMFIIESYKLMHSKEVCLQLLQEIHRIYIVAILPIVLAIIEPHLITFLDKFIAVLMEAVKTHSHQEDVVQAITSLLETFYFHIQNSDDSLKLYKFKENIYRLIRTKPFDKFASV